MLTIFKKSVKNAGIMKLSISQLEITIRIFLSGFIYLLSLSSSGNTQRAKSMLDFSPQYCKFDSLKCKYSNVKQYLQAQQRQHHVLSSWCMCTGGGGGGKGGNRAVQC